MQHWNKGQVKQFYNQAISPWGVAWLKLGDEMQHAVLHAQVLAACRQQMSETVSVDAMDELVYAMEKMNGTD
jgi:hypothetical protein